MTKARQAEKDRAAAMIPIVPPAEVYRKFFVAMKEGRFEQASTALEEESMRLMKRDLIRALKEASLEERAAFIKAGGFKSAPDIQLSGPPRVFVAWMRSGWRVKSTLEKYQQREIVSVKEKIRDDVCELAVEFKPPAAENIVLTQEARVWLLKLEIPVE